MLLQNFSRFVVEAEFLLNKSYIAKVICVNKEKPKMHCNGKCYLAKQLKQQEKQEQQSPNPMKEKFDVQPFFLPNDLVFTSIRFTAKLKYHFTKETISSRDPAPIFHPPTI